ELYTAMNQNPILPAPDWLIAWLKTQKIEKKVDGDGGGEDFPKDEAGKIKHGGIHGYLLFRAGGLRNQGLTGGEIEPILIRIAHSDCAAPIDEKKVSLIARDAGEWEIGR